jgi:hypothetical protein
MKKTLFAIVALLLVGTMSVFAQAPLSAKGNVVVDGKMDGFILGSGSGARSNSTYVAFPSKFAAPPNVIITLTGFSAAAGKDGNVNLGVSAENVTTDGFNVKANTWGDTRVSAVYATWVAVAAKAPEAKKK